LSQSTSIRSASDPLQPPSPARASGPDALGLLGQHGEALNAYFRQVLGRYEQAPVRLMEAVQYSLMAGGKRLRPALVLETFAACAGPEGASRRSSALAAAGAMELIHTFSLVHDDLPAMDDDDLRRGRPTNHKVFGEAMAVLAGDAMTVMAFELLAADAEATVAGALVRELAHASGPEGMIGGQVLDIDGENQALSLGQLQHLHRMKTGALLRASCRMGAITAGSSPERLAAVTAYGEHLGLAFQIVDDLLDVTSTPEQMGKATGKDAAKGKNTYPSLLGIEKSQREAERQLAAALEATRELEAGAGLRALAAFVVTRKS
jgi:geranylgeranyl diphosphate synthase type II